jgi:hypothetical protein
MITMQLTINRTFRLATAVASVVAAALLVSPAQGAGPNSARFYTEHSRGQNDPGLGGRYGANVLVGRTAPFYTEHTGGQNDPGLGSHFERNTVGPARFVTEHFRGQNGSSQLVEPTIVQVVRPSGFDWEDAGMGAAGMFAALLLLGGAGIGVHRSRTRPASF